MNGNDKKNLGPLVQSIMRIIDLFHWLSIGRLLNKLYELIKRVKEAPPAISEIYVFGWVVFGVTVLLLLRSQLPSTNSWNQLFVYPAYYRIFDILIFALHWLLVANEKVKDLRRSLIMFFVNIFEIGVFFAIIIILSSPNPSQQDVLGILSANLIAVLTLGNTVTAESLGVQHPAPLLQLTVSWLLIVTIIGNVVGSIRRKEK